jgi:hypothetical protein
MTYNLYIDDERNPRVSTRNWVIARSGEQVFAILREKGCPEFVSFDNDLGEEIEGYDIAKFLVEQDLNNPGYIPDNFHFIVHSANIIAGKSIWALLTNYLAFRKAYR